MKAIEINRKRCKKCGICTAFCPKNVFESSEDGAPRAARPEDCVGCRLCEKRCPDFAIEVREV
ncbi:MAG: 4Fe-4S dicluster domain-containing protein [Anaerovoracaceae bacterium]|jgi:2-oxoglutarate ferredoxin oxidoreductase subunit delta